MFALHCGCYSSRIQELGPGERIVEERPGTYSVRIPHPPTPEDPSFTIYVSDTPEQKVQRGKNLRIHRQKEELKTLGAGLALQWGSLVAADRLGGKWKDIAVGVNALGVISLLTRGRGGGYLGWFLPEKVEKEGFRVEATQERLAPAPVPVPQFEVIFSAAGRKRRMHTDANGMVRIDLIADLGMQRYTDDRAVPLDISVPGAGYQRTHLLLPSEFLYPSYRFPPLPYYADPSQSGAPAGFTRPGQSYRVVGKRGATLYAISTNEDRIFYLQSDSGQLAFYGLPPHAPPSDLLLDAVQLKDSDGDGLFREGDELRLTCSLTNRTATAAKEVEIRLRIVPFDDFTPPPPAILGTVLPGKTRTATFSLILPPGSAGREFHLELTPFADSHPLTAPHRLPLSVRPGR